MSQYISSPSQCKGSRLQLEMTSRATFGSYRSNILEYKQTYKVKVKLSLLLTKYHAMKTYWINGGIAPSIL